MGTMRNTYKKLVGKPEGKMPLVRPRCRWMDDIKMVPKPTGFETVDWIHVPRGWLL
jgi:hypothetical protein